MEENKEQAPKEPGSENENKEGGSFVSQEDFKNMKSEFNRKTDNVVSTLAEQNEMLKQMFANSTKPAPKAKVPEENLEDLMYDDPKKYAEVIADRAEKKATEKITSNLQSQQRTQSEIAKIQVQYTEFQDSSSDASINATAQYNKLPDYLQGTPEGAKLAMMNVIDEMGLEKVSKKATSDNEDFVVSGGKGSRSRKQENESDDLDPRTIEFANKFMGLDTSDPKIIEKLKAAHRPEGWRRYKKIVD